MPRPPHPVEVRRLSEARVLQIEWSDAHVSEYPFAYLRGWCPCAACQGHGGERRFVHADSDLERVNPVGRYALNPVWRDGHGSRLREKMNAEERKLIDWEKARA